MSDLAFHEIFPLSADTTEYVRMDGDWVETHAVRGRTILEIAPEGLTALASRAFYDIAHLLRPAHLAQVRAILDDAGASANDRFVALELLKNANIAAGGVLPMCQDTGTAIISAKKGECVWTGGQDAGALSEGVLKAYVENNLRYSQLAPLTMFEEAGTGTNLPAQIRSRRPPDARVPKANPEDRPRSSHSRHSSGVSQLHSPRHAARAGVAGLQ